MVLTPAVQPDLSNFNFNSILSVYDKSRSIMNLPDINARLIKPRQENIISRFVKSSRR